MPAPTKSQLIDSDSTVYQFITIRQPFRELGQTVEDITRPGVDGHAFRLQGMRGEKFDMLAIRDYTDFIASDTDLDNLTDLRGSLVKIIDDYGITHNNVLLLDVIKEKEGPALAAVGGVSGASVNSTVSLVTFRFTLQDADVPGMD